ncbi:2-oxoacid:acceptor oxidoreductase subunit alpha [Numidum massiliense]|uniref:2-oxoacid:acceptor oxidoreductase subunit alpha n=1 Tax=Numidum massiliense TaxID=1522315 RepID=UPI0006D59305|nr:2-oxoacid:acceptor oxidoreductase subunit alpha [Numidum massiliense]
MLQQLSWMVGGQQGEGIDPTGSILAKALNRQGYYIYGYRHFSSRIKGGHSNYKVRISTAPLLANADALDMIVAFDQETIDLNAHELRPGGLVIGDSKFKPSVTRDDVQLIDIPLTKIAEELGTRIMKNMVAIGATTAIIGVDPDIFTEMITAQFARKGDKIVSANLEAIKRGRELALEQLNPELNMALAPADGTSRLLMMGNDAVSLGALAAGCRVMPAYPITPASDIMEHLVKQLPDHGGVVLQTEDEIAAAITAIGASYAGARAMTATSGPGLSLMMEAIGLSGMTETPLVIIDTQRGGPSTGLPTKNEQSDVNAALYGTHGEIPRIVLAPSTAEECFYDTVRAFNYADEYQVPVILLTDLALSLALQTVEQLDYCKVTIERGKLLSDEEVAQLTDDNGYFHRYADTEDGISPRAIPGQKGGTHYVTGVEHNDIGRPVESADNRQKMMNKRMRKLEGVELPDSVVVEETDDADWLIVGFGSTMGTIAEARAQLSAAGIQASQAQIRVLSPFPTVPVKELVERYKRVLVVESNATGQLAAQIKQRVGATDHIFSLVKYDGVPFFPLEISEHVKELNASGNSERLSYLREA